MSLLRRRLRHTALACLSLTLCVTMTASCALINIESGKKDSDNTTETNKIGFTDVTDKYDTSALTATNFNSEVLEGQKTTYETRTVIVTLSGKSLIELMNPQDTVAEYMKTPAGREAMRSIDREQRTFLSKLDSQGIKYTLKNKYSAVTNAVAVELDTSYVKKIKSLGGVSSAVIGKTYLAPQTTESSSGSGVDNNAHVYDTGIYDSSEYSDLTKYPWGTGAGTVVAIIDTGLDYSHDAFQTPPESPRFTENSINITGTKAFERMAQKGVTISESDVYVSSKVPFAFDYADDDTDVYPSYSNHGTHVAGIVAGSDDHYIDKNGNYIDKDFKGVAPDAQLVICKTFTDDLDDDALGGAESENIMSALEDCVILGVDVINMSLGTTSGFTTTDDGDDEGEQFNKIYESIREKGISLICAASNDYSAGYGSIYGTNLASNPDSGTVGSPSTYYAALSVASISGKKSQYVLAGEDEPIFFQNASNGSSIEYDFVDLMLGGKETAEFEYVNVGTGLAADYTRTVDSLIKGRIALVKRGSNTFQAKVEIAKRHGAIGVIIWNNVSGGVRMSLGDVADVDFAPSVSISMDAGKRLVQLARSGQNGIVGKLTMSEKFEAGPFMSPFSSWGTTNDLKIKPEITAHGGEITSTVPGGYAEQSGTSMASPNMAGLVALVRNYVKTELAPTFGLTTPVEITQLTNQLILSTASTVYDETGLAYSPRKQGSGLANLKNIVNTKAYLFTDEESDGKLYYEGKDGRPKIELGSDVEKDGKYTFSFKVKNFDTSDMTFTAKSLFMTETLDSEGVAVAERAHMLEDIAPVFSTEDGTGAEFSVPAGQTRKVTVTLELSDDEKKYIDDSFKNGMFVEGFIKLVSTDNYCDLNLPFMGFYGDWESAPMLDYTAFDISESQQDTSVPDSMKKQETVFATQAYGSYSNEQYVIPLGSYVYTLSPSEDPMYAKEEYCAISCFNDVYREDGIGNYITTYNVRCVYAGLLRNAQKVVYNLYDAQNGELITTGEKYRISKAYANGGSSTPAFLELKLGAEELGLKSNGKYTFEFQFIHNYNKDDKEVEVKPENIFKFDFYVDYDAPVLKDARLRYFNTTDASDRDIQRTYLDLDVFDNHYPQSVKLCYIDTAGDKQELKLATDYVTPVRNPNRNGVTTVSIDVTDYWEKYKDVLAVELDDYALNHTSYILSNISEGGDIEGTLNKGVLPETFSLAEGEENITLRVNEMHKVQLVYDGDADLSNFEWTASSSRYFAVKNGEIVGLASTNGKSYPVSVSNRKGFARTINVTVLDSSVNISGATFSFGTILNQNEALVKASGRVPVYAGKDIQLEIEATPWYYPTDKIQNLVWSSANEDVATVTDGVVHTKKKGETAIRANFTADGINRTCSVTLVVQDEFTVSNLSLTRYEGEGETVDGMNNVVIIPADKNIMSIGDEAFEDNTVIQKVIIPKTVTSIGKNAFKGCTALKEVIFLGKGEYKPEDFGVDNDNYTKEGFVADADLNLINKNAFEGCTSLKVLDLRFAKIFTVAKEAFKDCESLDTIIKSTAIGSAYDRAFMGCESLTKFDMSGLHYAGANVFTGCENLSEITTEKFSAIGNGMFAGLTYVYDKYNYSTGEFDILEREYKPCLALTSVVIKTPSVGSYAFYGCENLSNVVFDGCERLQIGASAFEGCASAIQVNFLNCTIRSIGANAFKGCTIGNITEETVATASLSLYANQPVGDVIIKNNVLISYLGSATSYTIPSSVTRIGSYAFANSNLTSITIPNSVEVIEEGAFSGCKSLANVTFEAGSKLANIGAYAFANSPLTALTIPEAVTKIGDNAFSGCAFEQFTFNPSSPATLGDRVFSDNKVLKTVNLLDSNITAMGSRVFEGCTSLETAELPALNELGAYTFLNTPALKSATFNDNAKTTGNYTFASADPENRENFVSVTLGNVGATDKKEIGEGVFYNCAKLTSVNLNGATAIGAGAFYNNNRLATVTGLDAVETIGAQAFVNCNALNAINLNSAKNIGDLAFAIVNGRSYRTLTFPVAESIGERAFLGGNETEVTIPASLKTIGAGAFAGSLSLKEFKVNPENKVFFAEDGVLYRNIPNATDETARLTYGLVAYPSAKPNATYTVLDYTSRIDGYAFYGMQSRISRVIFPYSLKAVGHMSFFNSGIREYEFKGATAPALEAEYSEYIANYLEGIGNGNYRGYFYANFENYFLFYSELVTDEQTTPLTIIYPDNGSGYDNHVYSQYFATKLNNGVALLENTNTFIQMVSQLPTVDEISTWTTENKTFDYVNDISERVKTAHQLYDGFRNDEVQMSLVGTEIIDKFNAVETKLRSVKPMFGIVVNKLRLEASGNYKTQYRVGEKFDKTGLVVTLIYDDYSTEVLDTAQMTVVRPTDGFRDFDQVVELQGYGMSLLVRVYITEDGGSDGTGCTASGCGSIFTDGDSLFVMLSFAVALVLITALTHKKYRGRK